MITNWKERRKAHSACKDEMERRRRPLTLIGGHTGSRGNSAPAQWHRKWSEWFLEWKVMTQYVTSPYEVESGNGVIPQLCVCTRVWTRVGIMCPYVCVWWASDGYRKLRSARVIETHHRRTSLKREWSNKRKQKRFIVLKHCSHRLQVRQELPRRECLPPICK